MFFKETFTGNFFKKSADPSEVNGWTVKEIANFLREGKITTDSYDMKNLVKPRCSNLTKK